MMTATATPATPKAVRPMMPVILTQLDAGEVLVFAVWRDKASSKGQYLQMLNTWRVAQVTASTLDLHFPEGHPIPTQGGVVSYEIAELEGLVVTGAIFITTQSEWRRWQRESNSKKPASQKQA